MELEGITTAADEEKAAVLALLRAGRRSATSYAAELQAGVDPLTLLSEAVGLFSGEALERAQTEIRAWRTTGIDVLTASEDGYPPPLRAAHVRPPLLFVRGRRELLLRDAVAVVGSRQASRGGRETATAVAERLIDRGFAVISGLAAGIDTAAHEAALRRSGPTIAVIGTGVDRFYPPENRSLQQRVATQGAVVSQFWPDSPPRRQSFPMRNAVMAGMSLATVIVEATPTSGTRIAARMSLASGRRVLLLEALLSQGWARELSAEPGVDIFAAPDELDALIGHPSRPTMGGIGA